MDTTFSMLKTVAEKVRFYLDDPDLDAKYTDQYLVRYIIGPAMVDVVARLNLNQDNPVVVRHSISLVENQEYYLLPPGIQEVWRLATIDSTGRILTDNKPRGVWNPRGPGWALEGNLLTMRPFPTQAETVDLWYVPSFDVQMHYGTGVLRGRTVEFATTPTLGLLDRRQNAYAGCVLRLLPESPGVVQEMIIASYDAETRTATVRLPFGAEYSDGSSSSQPSATVSGGVGSSESSSSSDGFSDTVTYEVAPKMGQALWEAIACASACKLAVAKNVSEKKLGFLEREYKKAMKTITDNLQNMQMRTGKAFEKNTEDHPSNKFLWGN